MKAGLDHLMPMPLQWAPDKLAAALEAGTLAEADPDQVPQRRYTQQFRLGVISAPWCSDPSMSKAGG